MLGCNNESRSDVFVLNSVKPMEAREEVCTTVLILNTLSLTRGWCPLKLSRQWL